jgi:hypothetical protein
MSLPPPRPRRLIHTRAITCEGYLREDGLWEVEGVFTDRKTDTYREGDGAPIAAGVPLHGIRLRIAFDVDLKIHEAAAEIDHSPFSVCPLAAPLAGRLVGMTIGRGFMAAARHAIGGAQGCTHILELLAEAAGTAFQTLHDAHRDVLNARRERGEALPRPPIIDTCHALRANGPVVRKIWPEFALPSGGGDGKS